MRIAQPLAAIGLLVVAFTWLSLHAINTSAERDDRALAALEHFGMVDNALYSDVLMARIGLLRDYDPLVREVDALDRTLGLIRRSGAADGPTGEAVNRLAAAAGGEERLVERFKTDNALLQNSLAYFGLFSGQLGGSEAGGGALAASVSRLAAAMLRFTLDTSATNEADVESELNRLAGEKPPGPDAQATHALLAHGRLLRALLPATDALLRALAASPIHADENAVRSLILKHQAASRTRADRFRSVLYVLSLVLVGLLSHLGLRLQARAGALRRRAAFERMIAAFSVRLAQAAPRELNATIAGALGEMADFLGAERAYLVLSGGAPRTIAWRKPGSPFPGGWPERAPMLAAAVDQDAVHQGAVHQDGEGVLHVRRARDLFAGDEAAPFREAGLTGWACAWRAGADGGHWLLGFDALHRPLRITQAGELNLLRVALDAVANAVGRQSLEEERERLEAQLQQARRMETVGALASGIAHNFNNVIGAIMGHAEMAEAQAASAGRESGNIAAIRRAGQRAGELVEQILAFARPRDVPRTAIGVASSVREAASLLHASLPPGTELVIGALAEEALVRAAPAQLQQVILNLCINASQAMQGTGSVKVEARVQDLLAPRAQSHGQLRQGRYACIAVTDSGPGMDAATLGRIFEPFVTSRADGNGLGLTTVREIVREYGGAMHVESAPGAGSRFEAWLPCLAPPSLAVVAGAAAGPMPAPPLGRGDTLLVVNEDRTQLLRDEEILAALGYEPVGFADKEDALAACRAAPGRFRAAVVARVFTKEAAIALVAELHRILPSLPIVLAAPFCGRVDAKTLVGIGLSEVVSAPIAPAEIASALARALPPSSE